MLSFLISVLVDSSIHTVSKWEQSDVTVFIFRYISQWFSVVLGPKATDEESVYVHTNVFTLQRLAYITNIYKSQTEALIRLERGR